MNRTPRRWLTALTSVAALSLVLSGCASVGDSEESEEAEIQQEDTAAQYTTDLAREEGLRGTPTVYVGEERWETSEDFEEWIQDQLADHAD